ncbi:MAG: hypothetical protein K2X76_15315 [Sphingomonas sp.]|nr:hypothetical protein [Sphingomonas sp.]
MPANPADVARYTTNGVLVVSPINPAVSAAIAANFIDARDGTETEIEHFFQYETDCQVLLDESFALLSQADPVYLALELNDDLRLGTAYPIAPLVPTARLVDERNGLDRIVRVRAYAIDTGTDRASIEVIE